jgi:hypothetical protein
LRFLPTCFSFQKEAAPARIKLQSVDGPDALTQNLCGDTLPPLNSPELESAALSERDFCLAVMG